MELQKSKLKVGIMAVSTLQMGAFGLMGLVPLAIDHYDNVSVTTVQTAFTLPMLTGVPIMLTVGLLSRNIGKKLLLIAGLCFIFLFGIVPALFSLSFPVFMIMMAGLGMGIGCIMSTSTGLIADHFNGAERANMMGKQSAFVNFGGMSLAFAVGALLMSGWRNAFFVYLYVIPILFVVLYCIPNNKDEASGRSSHVGKMKLTSGTVFICTVFAFFGVFHGVVMPNVGLLVLERNLGDPATASFAVSIMTAMGIITGLLYGKISSAIRKYLLPMALTISICGLLLAGSASSTLHLYASFVVIGIGLSLVIPTGLFRAAQSVDQASSTLAISVLFAIQGVALFFSPIITNPLSAAITSGAATAQSRYFISAAVLFAVLIYAIIYVYREKENRQHR